VNARIRRATPADAPAILAGIETICAEGIYFAIEHYLPDAQWEAALYKPETVPDHLLVVAEVEGESFTGNGRLFPGPPGRKDRHVADLGLYVLPSYRRRGLGTLLMDWMLAWARQTGLRKVTLSVLSTNQIAIHLYQKLGFVAEGLRRQQYKIGSQYVDELLMAKFLTNH
jgi:hypothetical protein